LENQVQIIFVYCKSRLDLDEREPVDHDMNSSVCLLFKFNLWVFIDTSFDVKYDVNPVLTASEIGDFRKRIFCGIS
tara:strand:- start:336 stop:563 length:228 start_codon:yes stop_codon:yes gene_type:complete